MPSTAEIKQWDCKPYLRAPLLDGAEVPFTVAGGETVAVLFRPVTDITQVLRATGYVINGLNEYVVAPSGALVHITQAIEHRWLKTGAGAGYAPWAGGYHTGLAGFFDQEFEHKDAAGLPRTFPIVGYNSLIVYDDIDVTQP